MKLDQFPEDLRDHLLPSPTGGLGYHCLKCGLVHPPTELYYTCPACGGLLLLEDDQADRLKARPGHFWRRLFDYRRMLNIQPLSGIFAYHEFLAPLIPLEDIIYLGEGHTPVVAAPAALAREVGRPLFIKHDGQNPSASFKDRGMAAALSYLRYLIRSRHLTGVLAICASTGDTSAAAALYSAALGDQVKSAVLLPKGKVTLPQLSQPLGAGARVFELPGVFDDCMKVVEYLSENFQVALLNSKNPWRVLGQESYAFELAQQFDYDLAGLALLVPVGNAGNLTAILSGLLKLRRYEVIDQLPKVVAVQSSHADPVFRYYNQPAGPGRRYQPVTVRPSVAQAAMIGDPVSFPRVVKMVEAYNAAAGRELFFVVQVEEQAIMDNMIRANRSGLTICTQGGEGLAGLGEAIRLGLVGPEERAVVDSTAHALKFAEFQNRYFENQLQEGFDITARPELVNRPADIRPLGVPLPEPGRTQSPEDRAAYVAAAADDLALALGLRKRG
ncbi:MAG: pyridoxal-phosphate dependent enzyme [Candidatus Adiutrix sp.]|jgi:threonine synthase|nr:pyridoxal-phosphate dependent enzyme [Candidatus Adiutrix sp.]